MRLYRFAYSGYARFVQAALALARVPVELVDVPYGDRDELARLTGGWIQVPVVVTDDGRALTDSRRILTTLCAEDPRLAALVPAGEAATAWAFVDFCAGPLEDVAFRLASPGLALRFGRPWERALFGFVKERRHGAGCVAAWERDADLLAAQLADVLAPVVATLAARPFVLGERPSLADAALYGQLVMLEFGAPERVAALDPALLAWKRRLEIALGPPPYGRPARRHRSRAELDAALAQASSAAAARTGAVELIVVRTALEERACPPAAELVADGGVAGDRWAAGGHAEAQVTLMDARVAGALADRADWELFGDNLIVDLALGEDAFAPGDRLAIGERAIVEITALPHLGCRKFLARMGADALRWVNDKPVRSERRRGVHARVALGGTVRTGDVARRA
jgi:glutathione S-transferase